MDHGAARLRAELRGRTAVGAVVELVERRAIGSLLVCRVPPRLAGECVTTLEGTVVGFAAESRDPTRVGHVLRWNWAHAPCAPDALGARLAALLGATDEELPRVRLAARAGGAAYVFRQLGPSPAYAGAEAPATAPRPPAPAPVAAPAPSPAVGSRMAQRGAAPSTTTIDRVRDPFRHLRAHERVAVDVPCRYVLRGQELIGRMTNLSREGAFVVSQAALPEVGERVIVTFGLTLAARRVRVILTGATRWRTPEAAPQGGFGLLVQAITDGAKGTLFHAYLDHLIQSRE